MPDHMDNIITDTERVDWLCSHPANIKWNHRSGWIVSFGFPFGETKGRTLRNALDAAIEFCRNPPPRSDQE